MHRKLYAKVSALILPKVIRDGVNQESSHFGQQLKMLRKSGIPYTIVWTDDSIDALEKDGEKIKTAAKNFKNYILGLAKLGE